MKKIKLIIIAGSTGVGKSNFGIELAKRIHGEIVSADSMQIYRGMDIGTGKILPHEMDGVPHHMLDILDPSEPYSVEEYKRDAIPILREIIGRNRIPIVVGGTGLYINSLIYDLNFSIAPPNENIRSYYVELETTGGPGTVHKILSQIDPISADRIHPNQLKRIIRALEVFDYTGVPFSSFNPYDNRYNEETDFLLFQLERDRKELYSGIEKRVDEMVKKGLVEEVQGLLDKGYGDDLQSMQAIGYKEIFAALRGQISFEESIELLKRNTRRYAKRQIIWFKREEKRIPINLTEQTVFEALDLCEEHVNRWLQSH